MTVKGLGFFDSEPQQKAFLVGCVCFFTQTLIVQFTTLCCVCFGEFLVVQKSLLRSNMIERDRDDFRASGVR